MRIAICDDEPVITRRIEALLKENLKRKLMVNGIIDVFNSSQSLFGYINNENEYDLIYLDIEMPGLDGIALAKKIRENNREVLFIYISSHEKYFVDLFPVLPFRFIKKPVDSERFAIDFEAACEEINRKDYYFQYDYKGIRYRMPIRDIVYMESLGHNISITTRNRKEHFRGKLNEIEKQLKEQQAQFLRIHQSYLINSELVEEMHFNYVKMCNGETLGISQERRKYIRELYFGMEK